MWWWWWWWWNRWNQLEIPYIYLFILIDDQSIETNHVYPYFTVTEHSIFICFFSEILPNKHKHTQSWDTFINDTKFTLVTKFTFKMDIYNRKPKFKSWCCMIIIMKINQNVYVYMNFTMSWSLWIGLWSNFVSTMTNIEITIPFSCSFFSVFWLQLIMLFISIIQIMMIIIDQSNQFFFGIKHAFWWW